MILIPFFTFQLQVKSELQKFRFDLKNCTVIISDNQMSCENWHMASELLFDDNRSLLILQSSHIRRAEYKEHLINIWRPDWSIFMIDKVCENMASGG